MTEINWIEVRERVEQAIATLTTRRVADGYELELSGKASASWEEGGGVLEFSRQSGIPLDWLLFGDVGALIANAAGDHLQRENGHRIGTGLSGTRGYWQIQQAAW